MMKMSVTSVRGVILLTVAMAFAVATFPVTAAQTVTDVDVVSPAQVVQLIEAVRAPSANQDIQSRALNIGNRLLRSARYSEAAQLFAALAERQPASSIVIYSYALATFNDGKALDAEALAQRAFEIANQSKDADRLQRSADALVLLGVIRAVRGDDSAALKALREAIAFAPNHFDAQFSLGRLLFGMGDDNGAIRAFRIATTLKPSHPQALFFLASTQERSGDIVGALTSYRSLIATHPEMFEGHLGLGVLLTKRGSANREEGLKELRRALEINTNLYEARVALGRALVANGQAQDAIEHLERAAQLAPDNPEPHYQLSLAYRRLGRKDEAAAQAAIVKRIHESRRNPKVTGNHISN